MGGVIGQGRKSIRQVVKTGRLGRTLGRREMLWEARLQCLLWRDSSRHSLCLVSLPCGLLVILAHLVDACRQHPHVHASVSLCLGAASGVQESTWPAYRSAPLWQAAPSQGGRELGHQCSSLPSLKGAAPRHCLRRSFEPGAHSGVQLDSTFFPSSLFLPSAL